MGRHLLKALRARGVSVNVAKPLESGLGATGRPEDALALMSAAGVKRPASSVAGWTWLPALAPAEAMRRAGQKLELGEVVRFVRDVRGVEEFMLVETAGGLLSPLTGNARCIDLAVALCAPIILVAPQRLGVISQVSMAIEAAQSRNVRILAVVLNEMEDLPEEDAEANVWWIEQRYPDVPVLRSDSDGAAPQLLELLVREISGSALM